MKLLVLILALMPGLAWSDTVIATRTLRSQTIIGPDDLRLVTGDTPGALSHPEQALGMEARVTLYAGRPVRPQDLAAPALIERNQIVTLQYQSGPLTIITDARALGRAGAGDRIRVMNLDSRNTVTGRVTADGTVIVGPTPLN
ncbi:flagellar basal body P-ring formation chaperone FlgA [Actibacterium sp. XHP0104]|uniref:flagellar basal body P-ring formation chaperone FlgA n=1 Tax=Actibacterium sp. XHP0104 TaxID=2984335 RepID=UPI0021E7669F|nr:flagellar basal body P-ring formation chaperone FlgA [Actibacterium sp. XHP0104]MCV2881805.1 flagellar basal body P-ring formation chaperone FlgA [Actibacterium sp. XHP0104]